MERAQTDQDWKTSQNPVPLLEYIRRTKFSPRKMRLLMCAFARLMPDDNVSNYDTKVILASEQYADGEITHVEVYPIRTYHRRRFRVLQWSPSLLCPNKLLADSSQQILSEVVRVRINKSAKRKDWEKIKELRHNYFARERPLFANIVREVFSNPFNPVHFESGWLTENVIALASGIYTNRSFEILPILADAIEEAGCNNSEILNHCRSDSPHFRGCWVIDQILGKN